MSPAWSPDGEWLAYVLPEARSSAIYAAPAHRGAAPRLQRVAASTARRPGRPIWQPAGPDAVGSGGNLDVYVLELATQALTRLTDDPGIDTEPALGARWQRHLLHLDRSGGPQVYRVADRGDRPEAPHLHGVATARPRLSRRHAARLRDARTAAGRSPSRRRHRREPVSKGRSTSRRASRPTAPRRIYAGRDRGQGALATVSADGLITQRLKSDRGGVREPPAQARSCDNLRHSPLFVPFSVSDEEACRSRSPVRRDVLSPDAPASAPPPRVPEATRRRRCDHDGRRFRLGFGPGIESAGTVGGDALPPPVRQASLANRRIVISPSTATRSARTTRR